MSIVGTGSVRGRSRLPLSSRSAIMRRTIRTPMTPRKANVDDVKMTPMGTIARTTRG
jgi:hypothetical protein